MKRMLLWTMLCLLGTVALVSADTFVLKNGKQIEGSVLRTTEAGKVTLKTKTGIVSYDVLEFDDATLDNHFDELATKVEERRSEEAQARQVKDKGRTKPESEGDDKMSSGLPFMLIAGYVIAGIGSIWLIIVGFAESPVWGICLILFNGIAGIAFLILHWEQAKGPFFTGLVGTGLIVAAMLLAH